MVPHPKASGSCHLPLRRCGPSVPRGSGAGRSVSLSVSHCIRSLLAPRGTLWGIRATCAPSGFVPQRPWLGAARPWHLQQPRGQTSPLGWAVLGSVPRATLAHQHSGTRTSSRGGCGVSVLTTVTFRTRDPRLDTRRSRRLAQQDACSQDARGRPAVRRAGCAGQCPLRLPRRGEC